MPFFRNAWQQLHMSGDKGFTTSFEKKYIRTEVICKRKNGKEEAFYQRWWRIPDMYVTKRVAVGTDSKEPQ